ncbi:MAG: FAD-dependent oxidoreductase [Casimicrobiaceae bacterium]
MSRRILIVGASAAGVAAAETLQRLAPEREVVLLGDEPTLAHDRPPLSKQVLEGAWTPEQAELLPPFRREAFKAELILGKRATAADLDRREVSVDDGSTLAYEHLVVATGVRPRTLAGRMPEGVRVLRHLADCLALRAAMQSCGESRLVIIGGGFIGLEVAATARKLGVSVTVVEPAPGTLALRMGQQAATRLIDLHVERGVDFRFNIGVSGYLADANNRVRGVELTDGTTIEASVVLVAIGCTPNVEWLKDSGLDLTNGVVCDEFCRAAPGVWAAGDVASWRHVSLGRHVRVEHRLNASEQGAAVAANIVGPLQPYVPTPFFWSDQYGIRVQLAGGIHVDAEETVEQLNEGSYLHTFRSEGRLVGVLGWNAAKAMMPLRRELAAASH